MILQLSNKKHSDIKWGFTPLEIKQEKNYNLRKCQRHFLSLTGFTFVELMLVVAIIGVIFMLSIPKLRNTFENIKLETTTQRICHLLRFAQSKAVTTHQNIYLLYDREKQRFYLAKKQDSISDEEQWAKIEERYSVNIAEGIQVKLNPVISYEDAVLTFYSNASIEGSSIILTNDNISLQIIAKGTIGNVEVKRISE